MSEWGHDFRPDYLRLRPVIEELGRPPVMACTATATPKVADEIVARLGLREPERVRSGFDRPNLSFDVLPFDGEGSVARKRAHARGRGADAGEPARGRLLRHPQEHGGDRGAARRGGPRHRRLPRRHGAPTRGPCSQAAFMTRRRPTSSSPRTRSAWASTRPTCARSGTVALPSSLEAYYQEAGRAGRDGAPARAVLLASRSDLGRLVRFIREAEVSVGEVGALVGRLAARADGGGAVELDGAGDDRDRVALSVAEQAGALALAPGARGRHARRAVRPRPRPRRGRAAVPRRRQPALGVLPQHRALRRHGRRLPPPADPRPLRRRQPRARRAAAAATSATRPTGCRRSAPARAGAAFRAGGGGGADR